MNHNGEMAFQNRSAYGIWHMGIWAYGIWHHLHGVGKRGEFSRFAAPTAPTAPAAAGSLGQHLNALSLLRQRRLCFLFQPTA
jgi:hypothetical protein